MSAQVILMVGQPPEWADKLVDLINEEPFVDCLTVDTMDEAHRFIDMILPDLVLVFSDRFTSDSEDAENLPATPNLMDMSLNIEGFSESTTPANTQTTYADVIEFCRQMRNDVGNLPQEKHRPVLIVHSETATEQERIYAMVEGADDIWTQTEGLEELRVRLLVHIRRQLETLSNPITRLPNLDIASKVLQRWINLADMDERRTWALTLIRLNHIETYHDVYGDMATNQVYKALASMLSQLVHPPDFVGHSSETNTLMMVTPAPKAEKIIKILCRQFEDMVPNFYSNADRKRGYLMTQNNNKVSQRVPLLSMSAGIVSSTSNQHTHYKTVFSEGMHLVHMARRRFGNTWLSDSLKISGSQGAAVDEPSRILIIESDDAFSFLLQSTLEMQGFDIATASNVEDAKATIASYHPHLVLLDALIEDAETGWQLCDDIKTEHPDILTMMLCSVHNRDKALQAKADFYLPKPFELVALFNTIDSILGKS